MNSEISTSPGDNLATLVIKTCTIGGIISEGLDEAMSKLPTNTRTLDVSNAKKIREFVNNNPALLNALTAITSAAANLSGGINATHVPTHGVAEFFPSDRPRGNGEQIVELSEVEDHCAVFSYDVVQQTPDLVRKDVDAVHVWKTTDEKTTNKTLDGKWHTEDVDAIAALKQSSVCAELPGAEMAAKYAVEDRVVCSLQYSEFPVLSTQSDILGKVNPDGSHDTSDEAKSHIARNVNNFRRVGEFHDQHHLSYEIDDVSPKVDGEPLFIRTGGDDSRGYAVSRSGLKLDAAIYGRFEAEDRKGRRTKFLVECWPTIEEVERVYLTHVWHFGIGNDIGRPLLKELLGKKNIFIDIMGKEFPLELPTFENVPVYDGAVLHAGTTQLFIKKVPTIDVKLNSTKAYLDTLLGKNQDWRNGLWEYKVERTPHLTLTPLRQRFDKTRENKLENILSAINSPTYHSVMDHLEDKGLPVGKRD